MFINCRSTSETSVVGVNSEDSEWQRDLNALSSLSGSMNTSVAAAAVGICCCLGKDPGMSGIKGWNHELSWAGGVKGPPGVPPDDSKNSGQQQDTGKHQQHHWEETTTSQHVSTFKTQNE